VVVYLCGSPALADTYTAACAANGLALKHVHDAIQRNDPWALTTFDDIRYRARIAEKLKKHFPSTSDEKVDELLRFVAKKFRVSVDSLSSDPDKWGDEQRSFPPSFLRQEMTAEEQARFIAALDEKSGRKEGRL